MLRIIVDVVSKFKTLFIAALGVILLLLSLVNATEIDKELYRYAVLYFVLLIASTIILYRIGSKRVFIVGLLVFALFSFRK